VISIDLPRVSLPISARALNISRDLAQGAFRMRGIGAGQSVTLLIIPEVRELMRRQLSKAGIHEDGQGAPGAGAAAQSQAALLSSVSAWLVINSMASERVQFDQLCGQNLANIWRHNAWKQLLDGYEHFKVRTTARRTHMPPHSYARLTAAVPCARGARCGLRRRPGLVSSCWATPSHPSRKAT